MSLTDPPVDRRRLASALGSLGTLITGQLVSDPSNEFPIYAGGEENSLQLAA